MQAADIFFLGVDVCQLGVDQRKVNVLAREYPERKSTLGTKALMTKPIILSHPMMPGLKEGQEKASKSGDPMGAIFMEDSVEEVKAKIKAAFCPPGDVKNNPCMPYIEHIIFPSLAGAGIGTTTGTLGSLGVTKFVIPRAPKHGGPLAFDTYEALAKSYEAKEIHPLDLKAGMADAINALLEPVRHHFKTDPTAKELLAQVIGFRQQ